MAENKRVFLVGVASKIQLYHIGFASFKIYARTDPETKSYSIKKERNLKFQNLEDDTFPFVAKKPMFRNFCCKFQGV